MTRIPKSVLLDHAHDLRDRIVLVTGGGSGFGRQTALSAGSFGAKVIVAELNHTLALETVAEIRRAGGVASTPAQPSDVAKIHSLDLAFQHSVEEYGRPPDVVFANAGVASPDDFDEDGQVAATLTKAAYPRPPGNLTLAVNLNGVLNTCALAQQYWLAHPARDEARRRRLVILSSLGGVRGMNLAPLYSTSKHSVLGYWHGICTDLERRDSHAGFECYAICPFFAKTPIIPPILLALLAGVPLISVETVVHTLIHVASRPPNTSGRAGGAILLPDPGDPAELSAVDYDPLSMAWAGADQSLAYLEKDGRMKRILRDLVQHSSGSVLLVCLGFITLVTVGVIGARICQALVPAWAAAMVGAVAGIAVKRGKGASA